MIISSWITCETTSLAVRHEHNHKNKIDNDEINDWVMLTLTSNSHEAKSHEDWKNDPRPVYQRRGSNSKDSKDSKDPVSPGEGVFTGVDRGGGGSLVGSWEGRCPDTSRWIPDGCGLVPRGSLDRGGGTGKGSGSAQPACCVCVWVCWWASACSVGGVWGRRWKCIVAFLSCSYWSWEEGL